MDRLSPHISSPPPTMPPQAAPQAPARCNALVGKYGDEGTRCIKPAVEKFKGRCSAAHTKCRFQNRGNKQPCKNSQIQGGDNCTTHHGQSRRTVDNLAADLSRVSIKVHVNVNQNVRAS